MPVRSIGGEGPARIEGNADPSSTVALRDPHTTSRLAWVRSYCDPASLVKNVWVFQQGKLMTDTSLIELRGQRITSDEHGNICLNDLYELAGRPENLQASQWARHKRTIALKGALVDRIVCNTHKPTKEIEKSVHYVAGRGGKAKTFAHPVLALEYAESLNPALGVEIKDVFLRYRANDISLANEIFDRIAEQVQEDEFRLRNREEMTLRNTELAKQGARAGCTHFDYAELHNSGYRGLYDGLQATDIHRVKKLTKSQKILDHMNAAEGAANVFRVTQAKVAMQQRKPKTPDEAFKIAHEAGVETRAAMKRIGGVMPEDMEPADAISKARKRLDDNKELLGKKLTND
jgi:hypothetical protein